MDIVKIFFVIILIILTAFFVASEFSIIRVRGSRINQLIENQHPKATAVKQVISNLDEYLSATQLGITITALGLGWLGEPTMRHILKPILDVLHVQEQLVHVLNFLIAFSIVTFLNVVVGEMAPKTIAIQKAEQVSLFVSKPLIWFHKIAFPFIWVLNHSASFITSIIGMKPASESDVAHSEEELKLLLSDSYKSGEINQSEFKYVNNIFNFDNRTAREVMVPRTEIISFSKDDMLQEFIQHAKDLRFTRYPIVEEDKDHVVGLVNIKEIFSHITKNKNVKGVTLESFTRPIIRVIENTRIQDLLIKMQKERIQMAILMDEYGGTAGLVTVEDILEEIVGEIRDEFDVDEIPPVRKITEDHFIVDGKILLTEINDKLGINLEDDDIDTIGGWMLTQNYDIQTGDVIEVESFIFKVNKMEDHMIRYIEIKRVPIEVQMSNEILKTP
ncbi:hemolysin family protein [Peribacillus huizhouensis]|uniref:hemolysin family protein n=1 Tax=Peribacillus huizhouensis TaxID=1501239 RepID=UPI0015F7D41C|nr:hemolysin family protein [Peribacillus huizhouensis]